MSVIKKSQRKGRRKPTSSIRVCVPYVRISVLLAPNNQRSEGLSSSRIIFLGLTETSAPVSDISYLFSVTNCQALIS